MNAADTLSGKMLPSCEEALEAVKAWRAENPDAQELAPDIEEHRNLLVKAMGEALCGRTELLIPCKKPDEFIAQAQSAIKLIKLLKAVPPDSF